MEVIDFLLSSLMNFGSTFFDFLTLPITEFLEAYSSDFSNFILKLLDFTGLSDFFGNFSLGGFFLGGGILVIMVVNIVYWFIP